jgi:hypothetical protein
MWCGWSDRLLKKTLLTGMVNRDILIMTTLVNRCCGVSVI